MAIATALEGVRRFLWPAFSTKLGSYRGSARARIRCVGKLGRPGGLGYCDATCFLASGCVFCRSKRPYGMTAITCKIRKKTPLGTISNRNHSQAAIFRGGRCRGGNASLLRPLCDPQLVRPSSAATRLSGLLVPQQQQPPRIRYSPRSGYPACVLATIVVRGA